MSSPTSPLFEAEFYWNGAATEVIVTGAFDNWSQSVRLQKTDKGFSAKVPVPWGKKIDYKFIVDGVWCVNDHFPTTWDWSGNINNYIMTPPEPPKPASLIAEEEHYRQLPEPEPEVDQPVPATAPTKEESKVEEVPSPAVHVPPPKVEEPKIEALAPPPVLPVPVADQVPLPKAETPAPKKDEKAIANGTSSPMLTPGLDVDPNASRSVVETIVEAMAPAIPALQMQAPEEAKLNIVDLTDDEKPEIPAPVHKEEEKKYEEEPAPAPAPTPAPAPAVEEKKDEVPVVAPVPVAANGTTANGVNGTTEKTEPATEVTKPDHIDLPVVSSPEPLPAVHEPLKHNAPPPKSPSTPPPHGHANGGEKVTSPHLVPIPETPGANGKHHAPPSNIPHTPTRPSLDGKKSNSRGSRMFSISRRKSGQHGHQRTDSDDGDGASSVSGSPATSPRKKKTSFIGKVKELFHHA